MCGREEMEMRKKTEVYARNKFPDVSSHKKKIERLKIPSKYFPFKKN
jgi:hypothetical protein